MTNTPFGWCFGWCCLSSHPLGGLLLFPSGWGCFSPLFCWVVQVISSICLSHVETGIIPKHPLTQNMNPLSNQALREQSAHRRATEAFTVLTESGTATASGSDVHLHVGNVRKTVKTRCRTRRIEYGSTPSSPKITEFLILFKQTK